MDEVKQRQLNCHNRYSPAKLTFSGKLFNECPCGLVTSGAAHYWNLYQLYSQFGPGLDMQNMDAKLVDALIIIGNEVAAVREYEAKQREAERKRLNRIKKT